MATAFWNEDNPLKPWGIMDPDSILDYPISFVNWLQGMGVSYDSHVVYAEEPLNVVESSQANGIVTVRLGTTVNYDADTHLGNKYKFTVTCIANDGQQDDRSYWLKLVER